MKKALFIIKILVAIAVLVTLFFSIKTSREKFAKIRQQPNIEKIKQAFAEASTSEEQAGERIFAEANDLLAMGDLVEARGKLRRIVDFYPKVRVANEARRILGEMNLDRLLARAEMSNKKRHKVSKGQNFIGIAQKYQTTLDMIMFLNDLHSLKNLQPGDELLVMPLNFDLVIQPEKSVVELWLQGEWVKTYAVQDMGLDISWPSKKTRIARKAGYLDGRRFLPRNLEFYRMSRKTLSLSGSPLELRSQRELTGKEDMDDVQALYLDDSDLEELAMLVRVKNDVAIRRTKN